MEKNQKKEPMVINKSLVIKNRCLWLALSLLATPMAAQEGSTIDLLSAYQLALKHDANFQAQRATHKAVLSGVPLAESKKGSTLRVQGNLNHTQSSRESGNTPSQSDSSNGGSFSLQYSQPLINYANDRALDSAKGQAAVGDLELKVAHQELMLKVAKLYFDTLAAQDNLELTNKEQSAITRHLELARERLSVGLGTTINLFEAEARLKLSEASQIGAVNKLNEAQLQLAQALGRNTPNLKPLGENAPIEAPNPKDQGHWLDQALKENLALRIARNRTALAKQQIGIAEAARLPSLSLSASLSRSTANGNATSLSTSGNFGINLSWPIYSGGAVPARVTESTHRYEAAQLQEEGIERSTALNTRTTYNDLMTNIRQVDAYEQAVRASGKALEAKQEGFKAGANSNLDVLDAQRDLFLARRDLLQSRYRYILNLLKLENLVGRTDATVIERINSWLER